MNDKTISNESEGKLHILREFEFYGGCIRVKISVKNTSGLATLDATLEVDIDDKVLYYDKCEPAYTEKNGKIILGNINPNTDRVIALYLDPLICAKEGTDINCHVNFKYADGIPDTVHMKTLKIKGVCPIFWTENDINIGRLKELIKELHSQDNKVYILPKRVDMADSLNICNNVIQRHDVRHIKTFKTTDAKIYECWYYGKTKVTKKDIVIKCAVRGDTESVEVFASGNDPENITWLLAEIGRNLTNEFEKLGKVQPVFNIHVKNSMLRGSNLLSFCDIDGACGGNVVIEDSFVGDTNIASRIHEDKEKILIEEQKKLDDVPKQEKQREADLLRKMQDVQREKDRQVRQKKEADRIQQKKDDGSIKPGKKSSGMKWFFGLITILAIVLVWYGTQYPNGIWAIENPADTQKHQINFMSPIPTSRSIVTNTTNMTNVVPSNTPSSVGAPKVTGVDDSDLTITTTKIMFNVNQNDARTVIHYGTKMSDLSQLSDWNNDAGSARSITLSGLMSGTTYYYSVYAYNNNDSSKSSHSATKTFETIKNIVTPTSESMTVEIRDFAFVPDTITVSTGTTVTWINRDNVLYTVTSPGVFDSGSMSSGQTFSYTFNQAGTFEYGCAIHPSMHGKVIVTGITTPNHPITDTSKFRVGPTVRIRPLNDVISKDQDGLVELYMDNPSINDAVLTVDMRISVPSGVIVYGEGFGESGASGVVYGKFVIPPGDARAINIVIKSEKNEDFSVQFSGLYWPGGNKDEYQPISLTHRFKMIIPILTTPVVTPIKTV